MEAKAGQDLPVKIVTSLHRYTTHRTPTGGFLRAVLENNLREAIFRADDNNLPIIPKIVAYIYWEMPALSNGSPERVQRWLEWREHE